MASTSALLKTQYASTHAFIMMIIGDLTQAQADRKESGANISPIAPIIAHFLGAEDFFVNMMFAGKATVHESGGWGPKTGIAPGQPRLTEEFSSAKYNLDGLRGYAQALFAQSENVLGSATEAQYEAILDTPLGKQPAADFLGGLALSHLTAHAGEVAALKGIQGLKGLPF